MIRKEIELLQQEITRHIHDGEMAFAISGIRQLLRQSTHPGFHYELESLEDNYANLLRYVWQGYEDPQRTTILHELAASLLMLRDELVHYLLEETYPFKRQTLWVLKEGFGPDPESVAGKIDEIFFRHEVSSVIQPGDNPPPAFSDALFSLVWLTTKLKDHDLKLIRFINREEAIPWYEKCLAVSSLTLSLLNFFDPRKLLLLSEFIQNRESQVYHRALTGFLLGLIRYNDRLHLYPDIGKIIENLRQEEDIRKDAGVIILQLLMAGETERIAREFQEEVLPDMQKMIPKIGDKLQLDDVVEERDEEGENPVWKEMIDEVPGLFEKIEKFSKMQMEGADVFMSTFAMLKRFDFFNQISHWFVPFYHDHPALQTGNTEDQEIRQRLMEGLEKAFYICNSDKYSFALNFQAIPAHQRSMIVTHFEAELEQMRDMASEEKIIDPVMTSNAIFTQYIQDLYRFFKIFPHKNDFDDIFRWKTHYQNLVIFDRFFDNKAMADQLAAFYFSKDHWHEAIEIYTYLESRGIADNQLYQKLGYAWQKCQNWAKAREAYERAELFDTDRQWVLKKLAWCSIKLNDYTSSLRFITEALKQDPENLTLHSQAGQCSMNLGDYAEAIRHYTQVRFFSPGNLKALRPIGYARFILGELGEAEEAYQEILQSAENPTSYDLMNAGHVALCLGKRENALKCYQQAMATKGFDTALFAKAFTEDVPYMVHNGIPETDLLLILEYLIMNH